MSSQPGKVIDATLRFARSNPELLAYANQSAATVGIAVDDLLRQAIDRVAAARAKEPSTLSGQGQPLVRAI
ncbi:MAG: hypothetical protein M3019_10510 [Candidatus Dormibacteraeota bacterium]|nr:hypothetical protein [Candidatus Dormibacteraeota bacterium]